MNTRKAILKGFRSALLWFMVGLMFYASLVLYLFNFAAVVDVNKFIQAIGPIGEAILGLDRDHLVAELIFASVVIEVIFVGLSKFNFSLRNVLFYGITLVFYSMVIFSV
jgi:hypothetical protein